MSTTYRPRTRGTTTQRGYGVQHRRLRTWWAPVVASGTVNCWRCGQPIPPGTTWHLGHTDDRTAWVGPEHAKCSTADGGRKTTAKLNARHLD